MNIFDTPEIPDEPADPYIAPTEHDLNYVLSFKQFKGRTIQDVIDSNHGSFIHWLCENLPRFSLTDGAWLYLQQHPEVKEEPDDDWLSSTFDDPRDSSYGSDDDSDDSTMASYYEIF